MLSASVPLQRKSKWDGWYKLCQPKQNKKEIKRNPNKTKTKEIKGNKMSQPAVLVYKSIHCCLVYFPDVLLIFCDLGEYSENWKIQTYGSLVGYILLRIQAGTWNNKKTVWDWYRVTRLGYQRRKKVNLEDRFNLWKITMSDFHVQFFLWIPITNLLSGKLF